MYKELIKRIKEFENIVIVRHIGVDPDALCSQLALRDSIKLTYPDKKVLAVGTGSSKFIHFGKLDKLEKLDNALLIVLDTPELYKTIEDAMIARNFPGMADVDSSYLLFFVSHSLALILILTECFPIRVRIT